MMDDGRRSLHAHAVATAAELPGSFALPSRHFVCLLAWDADRIPANTIASVATRLLEAGAVYVCTWGRDCERVHDVVDEVIVATDLESKNGVIMTTWHSSEALADAIWHAMFTAFPAQAYEATCTATLGLSIGSDDYAREIREAFVDPDAFSDRVLGAKGEH